ncbi:hypothetical protein A2U01_0066921, partial [Trifolium medium]|nr:hypothetical protein [Trifolium medium]
ITFKDIEEEQCSSDGVGAGAAAEDVALGFSGSGERNGS